ncbi:MAG: transporter solute receptor [Proteobacteria bacterium]|nr:transporter solute receptor [Pseudomonadota bacterium]
MVIHVASTPLLSLPLFSEATGRLSEQVDSLTGGEVKLVFHVPGDLAPAFGTMDQVSTGQLAAAWSTAGQLANRDSAFELLSAIPFGPGTIEYITWLFEGGGLTLSRQLFASYGIHNVPCLVLPPEGAGWFSKEIRSVDDLKGLRIRFFGLGGRVLARLGADVVDKPAGEIVDAIKTGEIEAAEYSLPSMDLTLGLQNIAKYYYFPGWHQPSTLYELYFSDRTWGELTAKQQETIETVCSAVMLEGIGRAEAMQTEALEKIKEQGIKLRRWSPDLLLTFEATWGAVAAEEMAANPRFKQIYESYQRFRRDYEFWKRFSYLR